MQEHGTAGNEPEKSENTQITSGNEAAIQKWRNKISEIFASFSRGCI